MNQSKRIESIDFIKGVCIFLVVWGHCIQHLSSGEGCWNNPVFMLIYSFHMPIFMLLSGFFFNKSMSNNFLQGIGKRFRQLIIPALSWSFILIIAQALLHDENFVFSTSGIINSLYKGISMNFWYLRSAFICFTLAFISFKVLRNDYMSFILSFFVFLLLPDNGSIYYDKFMYPFFWMGYFIHKEISYIMKYKKALFATSLILLLILLDSYSKEATIYFTGMSFYNYEGGAFVYSGSWTRLLTIIHRYIIGAVGSLSAFILLHQLFTYRPKFESIRKWGQYTLGIYVIHVLIIYTLDKCEVFQHVHFLEAGFFSFNFIVTIIISAILIFISIVIIKFIEKNRISTWLFLGKKL